MANTFGYGLIENYIQIIELYTNIMLLINKNVNTQNII